MLGWPHGAPQGMADGMAWRGVAGEGRAWEGRAGEGLDKLREIHEATFVLVGCVEDLREGDQWREIGCSGGGCSEEGSLHWDPLSGSGGVAVVAVACHRSSHCGQAG